MPAGYDAEADAPVIATSLEDAELTVVNTYMGEKAWQGKVKTDTIEKIPAHRFAETDEIAAAVLFLSCDESNMITGEDLVVDGGFSG